MKIPIDWNNGLNAECARVCGLINANAQKQIIISELYSIGACAQCAGAYTLSPSLSHSLHLYAIRMNIMAFSTFGIPKQVFG